MNDIVAELDQLIANDVYITTRSQLQRARDEIVALREKVADLDGWKLWLLHEAHTKGRAEALDTAATACRLLGKGGDMETALACAAAIRALK